MFFYRHQDNFIYNLHTGVMVFYLVGLIFLASALNHPLYLGALLVSIITLAGIASCLREMKTYLLIALPIVLLIMIINPLLSREGGTIIWAGPVLPVLGRLEISLEAVLYGGNMGLRLAVIIGVFGLFNLLVDPDKFLSFCARFVKRSAVTMSLTTRMLPNLNRRMGEIRDIYRTRGVNLSRGSKWQRLRLGLPLIKVLLLSALEDTFRVAESMEARAFGNGPRSYYSRERLKPRDLLIGGGILLALVIAVPVFLGGWGTYIFYPYLAPLNWGSAALAFYFVIVLSLLIPVILALGCSRWPSMRYKI